MAQKSSKKKTKQEEQDDEQLRRSEILLREADEELRREQMEKMWKRYGGFLLIACGLIVIATAINVYWQNHKVKQNEAYTDTLYSWLAQEDRPARLNATIENLQAPKVSQEWLNLFYAANDALEQQRYDDAAKIYKVLREHRNLGKDFRWLADLMELRLLMQTDTQNLDDTRKRLENLGDQQENPWRALAYFDAAIIAGQSQGNYAGGLDLLEKASTHSASASPLMSMIRDMQHLFAVQNKANAGDESAPDATDDATNAPDGEAAPTDEAISQDAIIRQETE